MYRTNKELNRYRRESASTDASQPQRVKARKYKPISAERDAELRLERERQDAEWRGTFDQKDMQQ